MKFLFSFILISQILYSQDSTNLKLIDLYNKIIFSAESKFISYKYDSAYFKYIDAFNMMKKINPKINGYKSDINNFMHINTLLHKNVDSSIINYNIQQNKFNYSLSRKIDSLYILDQNIRANRKENQRNDSLEKRITQIDIQNFNFIYKILNIHYPSEYEISSQSYSNLTTLMLHAAYVKDLKSNLKELLIRNIDNGFINPRLYVSTLSLVTNKSLGWEVGLTKFSFYNNKTKKKSYDNKVYMIKLTKEDIDIINTDRTVFHLPDISHLMKCCCFTYNNPKSDIKYFVPISEYSITDEGTYKFFMSKVSLYNCKKQ